MSDLMIIIIVFLLGLSVGVFSLQYIVEIAFKEFSKQFEKQIEYYKTYTNKVLQAHLERIDVSQTYSFEIRENFDYIEKKIQNIGYKIGQLNDACATRTDLENEIIKMKNIIKRQNPKEK